MAEKPKEIQEGEAAWHLLLRWRWMLGGTITVAFAVGQLLEALLTRTSSPMRLLFDVVGWGLLGGAAVWLSLTWASRLERRHQARLEASLRTQQELNRQLQRANQQLALLSEVNQAIADSANLDAILDGALAFPQRLVQAQVAVLVLHDSSGPITTRAEGAPPEEVARLRALYGLTGPASHERRPRRLLAPADLDGIRGQALLLPLHDGQTAIGWIELYLERAVLLAEDELALLETITGEIAEGIVSSRRRSREERAIYELEHAIAEERARIARDIHDGIAQTLAFRRMRIDLWLDWLTSDPQHLREELIAHKALLREQIAELRRAIFALRPIQFDELGFVGGLHRYIIEFANQHNWKMEVDLSQAPSDLLPELEAISFRIIQEALTNIAKHARATRVEVLFDQVDGGLCIAVRDNGQGFHPGQTQPSDTTQVGLRQMRERLAAIRGQLTIFSQPDAGTTIRAWIPLKEQQ